MYPPEYPRAASPQRLWLHALLFAATLVTTTLVGTAMQYDFAHSLPFDVEHSFTVMAGVWRQPWELAAGLPAVHERGIGAAEVGIALAREGGGNVQVEPDRADC